MGTTTEESSQSSRSTNSELLKIPPLTEEQMNELISLIPKPPLSKCQAQLHTLAGNVTVEVVEEPFEYIVAEDDISSDEEDEWYPGQVVDDYWGLDGRVVRRPSINFEGRQIQGIRRTDSGQSSSLNGGTSFGSGGTSQSAGTNQTEATSVDSRWSVRPRRSIYKRRTPSDLESASKRKSKES